MFNFSPISSTHNVSNKTITVNLELQILRTFFYSARGNVNMLKPFATEYMETLKTTLDEHLKGENYNLNKEITDNYYALKCEITDEDSAFSMILLALYHGFDDAIKTATREFCKKYSWTIERTIFSRFSESYHGMPKSGINEFLKICSSSKISWLIDVIKKHVGTKKRGRIFGELFYVMSVQWNLYKYTNKSDRLYIEDMGKIFTLFNQLDFEEAKKKVKDKVVVGAIVNPKTTASYHHLTNGKYSNLQVYEKIHYALEKISKFDYLKSGNGLLFLYGDDIYERIKCCTMGPNNYLKYLKKSISRMNTPADIGRIHIGLAILKEIFTNMFLLKQYSSITINKEFDYKENLLSLYDKLCKCTLRYYGLLFDMLRQNMSTIDRKHKSIKSIEMYFSEIAYTLNIFAPSHVDNRYAIIIYTYSELLANISSTMREFFFEVVTRNERKSLPNNGINLNKFIFVASKSNDLLGFYNPTSDGFVPINMLTRGKCPPLEYNGFSTHTKFKRMIDGALRKQKIKNLHQDVLENLSIKFSKIYATQPPSIIELEEITDKLSFLWKFCLLAYPSHQIVAFRELKHRFHSPELFKPKEDIKYFKSQPKLLCKMVNTIVECLPQCPCLTKDKNLNVLITAIKNILLKDITACSKKIRTTAFDIKKKLEKYLSEYDRLLPESQMRNMQANVSKLKENPTRELVDKLRSLNIIDISTHSLILTWIKQNCCQNIYDKLFEIVIEKLRTLNITDITTHINIINKYKMKSNRKGVYYVLCCIKRTKFNLRNPTNKALNESIEYLIAHNEFFQTFNSLRVKSDNILNELTELPIDCEIISKDEYGKYEKIIKSRVTLPPKFTYLDIAKTYMSLFNNLTIMFYRFQNTKAFIGDLGKYEKNALDHINELNEDHNNRDVMLMPTIMGIITYLKRNDPNFCCGKSITDIVLRYKLALRLFDTIGKCRSDLVKALENRAKSQTGFNKRTYPAYTATFR